MVIVSLPVYVVPAFPLPPDVSLTVSPPPPPVVTAGAGRTGPQQQGAEASPVLRRRPEDVWIPGERQE